MTLATLLSSCVDCPAPPVNGRVHERLGRIHPISGRLHGDVVIDAVGRIDPVIRTHLEAGAERNQHALGDVLLRVAHLAGAVAVHVDAHHGHVLHLVHVHVGRAGNMADAAGDFAGDREILILVAPRTRHLHVDGRGQPEVQNLPDDIGGLEEKRQIGIFAAASGGAFRARNPRWSGARRAGAKPESRRRRTQRHAVAEGQVVCRW